MSFKLTLPNGMIVEMDTTAELRSAVAALSPPPVVARAVVVQPVVAQGEAPPVEDAPLDMAVFRRFLRDMPAPQRAVLDRLFASPDGVADEQICDALGIEGNRQLGGTMGAISKKANDSGMTINEAFLKNTRMVHGVRRYRYSMTDGMRAAMTN